MAQIISTHSYRGGTGKSNTTANVATVLAAGGRTVCIVDTDIQSPGVHVLFGLDDGSAPHSLNEYLWGQCAIKDAAYEVTRRLGGNIEGRLFVVPSSTQAGEIAKILREGYDVGLLNDGFQDLIDDLKLDVLMIDTHPGLNEETLLSIAISDTLAIILRPDQQDYLGTGVTVEVARKLGVNRMILIVNKTPPVFDFNEVKARVEKAYGCEVAGVLPHSDEMMVLASSGIFVLKYPDHPFTAIIRQIAEKMLGD